MDNVDFFVCAHNDFGCTLTNPVYKLICGPNDDVPKPDGIDLIRIEPEISNIGFSEWQKWYWVWKHYDIKDYIGLMHYHRILKLGTEPNDVPDMETLFNNCSLVIAKPFNTGYVYGQYEQCHNIEDLNTVIEIILKDYEEYADACNAVMSNGWLFICNLMIMSAADFRDMCEFVFGVLFKFCEKRGIDRTSDDSFYEYIDRDISKYKKLHKKDDTTFREQARVCSFLAERLVSIWIAKNRPVMKFTEIYE